MLKKRYSTSLDRTIFKNYSSKGQVTIFIILGIVVVMALVLVLLVQQEVVQIFPGELIPIGKDKVTRYIDSCIEQIGEDGLARLGLQAGYVDVPVEFRNDHYRSLQLTPMTWVPYWAYGTVKDIPTLVEMKEGLDVYMEEHLRNCVLASGAFSEEFDIVERSQIVANTEIVESKVLFNVDWELEINDKTGELVSEILTHTSESPIALKKVYDTAIAIVERELFTLKLEDLTQDLLALEHPNLPLSGMEVGCTEKTWKVDEVKDTLKDMIRVNIGQLKVKGTEMVDFPEGLEYYQNHYIWDLGNDFAKQEISTTFRFDNSFPFIFQVTPTDGRYMKSGTTSGGDLLSKICMQLWKFTYDVTYPVLVQVRDDQTGYIFNMPFTVHLQRNFPNRENVVPARGAPQFVTVSSEEFCGKANVPMNVIVSEVVESSEDGVNYQEPLEDADVTFTCLKYKCDIGKSDFDFNKKGYQAGIEGYFPNCVGGLLRANKDGYKEGMIEVVTDSGAEFELKLTPLFKVPLEKIEILYRDAEGSSVKPISEDAIVKINLRSVKKDELGRPFHETDIVTTKGAVQVEGFNSLELLAGADFTYDVDITVLEDGDFFSGYRENWTIKWDELRTLEKLTFTTIRKESGSELEKFSFIGNLIENSKAVGGPELK